MKLMKPKWPSFNCTSPIFWNLKTVSPKKHRGRSRFWAFQKVAALAIGKKTQPINRGHSITNPNNALLLDGRDSKQPPGMQKKPLHNGIHYQPQLVFRTNHQQYDWTEIPPKITGATCASSLIPNPKGVPVKRRHLQATKTSRWELQSGKGMKNSRIHQQGQNTAEHIENWKNCFLLT